MNAEPEHWRALVAGFWGGVVFALYHLSAMLLAGQRPEPWDIIKAVCNAAIGVAIGAATAHFISPGVAQFLPDGWRGNVGVAGFMIGVLAFSVIPSVIKAGQAWVTGKVEGIKP